MGFFTVGNLITLGIAVLLILLFRQLDKGNRNLKLLRDYSEKLKKDLSAFVEEQEKSVKDYSVSLNVERDSAKELMKHLQITEEGLAEKARAMARIDTQLQTYESSLAELDKMTGRVQENMNRVRDESAFVEAAGRRVSEAKAGLVSLEREMQSLQTRVERENAESLEKATETVMAAVKSTVSDLGVSAASIARQVEEHHRAINGIEEERAAVMARDVEKINKILSTAVEQAGRRADKMEEAALVNLRGQAEERILKYKTAEEEKLRSFQENAKARVAEIQGQIKSIRDEWRAERAEWESKDKALQDERRKETQELSAQFSGMEKHAAAERAAIERQVADLSARTEEAVRTQEGSLHNVVEETTRQIQKASEDMKQKALEITGAKLEEYRHAQDAEFRRLEALADDSRNLDAELRRNMQEVIVRIRDDFSRYEREASEIRKAESDKFASAAEALKEEMEGVENDLSALKATAYENVSEKLKVFEDDFMSDLTTRSGEIDRRLLEWQDKLDMRLSNIGEEAETSRRELERSLTEEMRRILSSQSDRIVSELERLKAEAAVLEDEVRGQMNAADDSVSSFREQLDQNIEEARKEADLVIKSEIGKHSLATAESLKQYQRDLDVKFREMAEFVRVRNGEVAGLIQTSRSEFDEAGIVLAAKVRELDSTVEDARRRVRDLAAETDSRIASVRSAVEDAERHIREAVDQTKVLDKADTMRLEMERRIEDLKSDMDRLDQRRVEAAQLENDFVKIKRLADDMNNKMTRFINEQRRMETMEVNFNRFLQVSRSVEEKLTQVSSSDDMLQGIQFQIRKLEESLNSTEEKYQRVERKSQILDNTNDGIDRNFRVLQESEKLSARIGTDLERYTGELDHVKTSIEKLAGESEKAREAVDRIDVLDNALEEIEERIKSMQRVRQWFADAETRLEKLNKDAQIQARAIDTMVKGGGSGSPLPESGGTLTSQQKKENIITLARMGWKKDEIAKNMKISLSEVELTLEVAPKD